MINILIHKIQYYSGPFGCLALLAGLALLIIGLALLFKPHSRKIVFTFFYCSFLPFILGLLGTLWGRHNINLYSQTLAESNIPMNELHKELIKMKFQQTIGPTCIGIISSIPIIILGLLLFWFNRKRIRK